MTKIFENELYELQKLPKNFDYDTCFKCKSDEFEAESPYCADLLEGWEIRTCDHCEAKWELSLYKNGIYFYGEDETEVQFNR